MARFQLTYTREQFTDAVDAAYQLGIMAGEKKAEQRLVAMQTGIKALATEVARLDRDEPLVGVVVPNRLIRGVYKVLNNKRATHFKRYYYGLELKKLIVNQLGEDTV